MKVAIILGTVTAFLAVLAVFVLLTLAGKDTTVFIGFATSAGVFLIPQLFNLIRTHQTAMDVAKAQADITEVKHRTNGPLTDIGNQVNDIAAHLDVPTQPHIPQQEVKHDAGSS